MMEYFSSLGPNMSMFSSVAPIFLLAMAWSMTWKGLGLWHAAKNKAPWWFIAILLINSLGILEIIYLFAILKVKNDQLFK